MHRRLSLLSLMAAAVLAAMPSTVAAAEPTLTASVVPGQEIDVAGSGFPADADVQLVILRNGADAGTQALRTKDDGSFSATIEAGPGRGGVYTMTATSGAATASVEALAVETAGGLHASPPPTDAIAAGAPAPGLDVAGLAAIVLIGACALSVGLAAIRQRTSPPGAVDRS